MPNDGFLPQTSHTLAMTHTSELAGLKPEDRFASCEPAPWNNPRPCRNPKTLALRSDPRFRSRPAKAKSGGRPGPTGAVYLGFRIERLKKNFAKPDTSL
jgi:hypothetical protein